MKVQRPKLVNRFTVKSYSFHIKGDLESTWKSDMNHPLFRVDSGLMAKSGELKLWHTPQDSGYKVGDCLHVDSMDHILLFTVKCSYFCMIYRVLLKPPVK